jgi:hypothetical protein
MNSIADQVPVCPPSRQLSWPATESSVRKVPVVFDKSVPAGEAEVVIHHAAPRELPAAAPRSRQPLAAESISPTLLRGWGINE